MDGSWVSRRSDESARWRFPYDARMVFDRAGNSTDDVDEADRRPFTLRPFRGLRFDPETVGDLGTVVSPPYDVLDADTVRDLEAANRRNIVRLILSRRFERPYLAVRQRLHKWGGKTVLGGGGAAPPVPFQEPPGAPPAGGPVRPARAPRGG